jgi:hypothetical protein
MTSKPRNRIVVFRLSQDDYRLLKEVCGRRGARNLSDFTRTEVLEFLQFGAISDHLNCRFASIEQQVAVLQSQFIDLLGGKLHAQPEPQP